MALVLTRKLHEEVVINDDIRVSVVKSRKGLFQIQVVAPSHVKVWRLEIWEEKQREKLRGGAQGEGVPAKGTEAMPSAA